MLKQFTATGQTVEIPRSLLRMEGTPTISRPPPVYNFDAAPELQEWKLSARGWLESKNKHFDAFLVSAVVFDPKGRVLLVRRAEHDSFPCCWEPPGGGVDWEDESVLHGCARELWEEAGVAAKRMLRLVNARAFPSRKGNRIIYQVTILVEADLEVGGEPTVDPQEHSEWMWATEEEVKAQRKTDGADLQFTALDVRNTLITAFQMWCDLTKTGDIRV
jgi:ADP-ribose pyrophosphatase YjhB (NUDIX family)